MDKHFYWFGPFKLDAENELLWKDGEIVDLEPMVFRTLLVLVQYNGRLVTKDELLASIWGPDRFVNEGSISKNVSVLRKILGDSPEQPEYVVTKHSRGYMFVADVRYASESTPVETGLLSTNDGLAPEPRLEPENPYVTMSLRSEASVSTQLSASLPVEDLLSDNDTNVLRAFDSGFAERSAKGIASDTGFERDEAANVLGKLRALHLVESKREDGGLRWYITNKGRDVLAAMETNRCG